MIGSTPRIRVLKTRFLELHGTVMIYALPVPLVAPATHPRASSASASCGRITQRISVLDRSPGQ